jgi:hypothetical protein
MISLAALKRVSGQFCGRHANTKVILQFTSSLKALALKMLGLTLAACGIVDVAKVVQDEVGAPLVAQPRVKVKGPIAMFDCPVEVADGASRNAQGHMGIRYPEYVLSVGGGCERLVEIGIGGR